MRRCERPGLYFQTKFFCNHSQLFSCWSTLRCYVKTLRKDQRIINWKSLDRISTCQLKCMWPRLLRYWDIQTWRVMLCVWGTFPPSVTQITGFFNRLIIRAGRYQESPVSHGHTSHHVSFPFPHCRHAGPSGRDGIFKFKSPLWPWHQLPLTLFEFQSNDASPFFSTDGLPSLMAGPCDHARPPGQLVTQPGDHCALLTVGDLSPAQT